MGRDVDRRQTAGLALPRTIRTRSFYDRSGFTSYATTLYCTNIFTLSSDMRWDYSVLYFTHVLGEADAGRWSSFSVHLVDGRCSTVTPSSKLTYSRTPSVLVVQVKAGWRFGGGLPKVRTIPLCSFPPDISRRTASEHGVSKLFR